MSIPLELLVATESRAPGFGVYGGAGLKKTNAIHTLPPPILHLDIGEGGTASVLPWISRRRDSAAGKWTVYSQEMRQSFMDLLDEDTRKTVTIGAAPFIDVVHFDNTSYAVYQHLSEAIANLDTDYYNSIAIDSLQELSVQTQTYVKGTGGYDRLMTDVPFGWVGAQERAFIALRKLRNYRDQGVFVYLIGSEAIAKDYVRNPMEKRDRNTPAPEAYSVRGTVDLPGALAGGLSHIPDVLMRAKLETGAITWITEPEPLPGGGAHWDAKDRYGRLPKRVHPNFRLINQAIYGEAAYKALYSHCLEEIEI